MKIDDRQYGKPEIIYIDTKTNIESLAGVSQGMLAFATDTNEIGTFTGTYWVFIPYMAQISDNKVLASNTGIGGASGLPTFRSLVATDLPTHTHATDDITSGTMATARLGSGTASSATFLRGDNTWSAVSGASIEWTGEANTLSYSTATMGVFSGVTLTDIYSTGTKLKLTNNSQVKYFYVVKSVGTGGNTNLYLLGHNGAVLENSAITNVYYSKNSPPPSDFPSWFTFTPSWTASTNPALGGGSLTGSLRVSDMTVQLSIVMIAAGDTTFGSGRWSFALPITTGSVGAELGFVQCYDSSTGNYYGRTAGLSSGGTSIEVFAPITGASGTDLTASVPFTWASGDTCRIELLYQII